MIPMNQWVESNPSAEIENPTVANPNLGEVRTEVDIGGDSLHKAVQSEGNSVNSISDSHMGSDVLGENMAVGVEIPVGIKVGNLSSRNKTDVVGESEISEILSSLDKLGEQTGGTTAGTSVQVTTVDGLKETPVDETVGVSARVVQHTEVSDVPRDENLNQGDVNQEEVPENADDVSPVLNSEIDVMTMESDEPPVQTSVVENAVVEGVETVPKERKKKRRAVDSGAGKLLKKSTDKGKRSVEATGKEKIKRRHVPGEIVKARKKKFVPSTSTVEPTDDPSWSQPQDAEDDAKSEEDVVQILKKRRTAESVKIDESRSRVKGKRIAQEVPKVSTKGVKLTSMTAKAKWSFVCARNIMAEKTLSKATQDNADIMKILQDCQIMTTVAAVGPYWTKLVQEFISSISEGIDDSNSPDYHMVTLRNHTFDFSPDVINYFLKTPSEGTTGAELKLDDIVGELTGQVLSEWPKKGQLPTVKLSMKYAVLHKVCIVNLVPTSHSANVTELAARVIYMIGSKSKFNYGEFMFDLIVGHAQSYAKLKPIAYPRLICSLLLAQAPDILTKKDVEGKPPGYLTISRKLFEGTHVADIELTVADKGKSTATTEGESVQMLKEELQHLEKVIHLSMARKSIVEAKLLALSTEDNAAGTSNIQAVIAEERPTDGTAVDTAPANV